MYPAPSWDRTRDPPVHFTDCRIWPLKKDIHFVAAVDYCLNLPTTFSQPGNDFWRPLCTRENECVEDVNIDKGWKLVSAKTVSDSQPSLSKCLALGNFFRSRNKQNKVRLFFWITRPHQVQQFQRHRLVAVGLYGRLVFCSPCFLPQFPST